MLGLGLVLQHLTKSWQKTTLLAALVLLVVVCQIQTYQYRYYEIHWSEMTQEKYWDVFLMRNRLGD